jgi:putative peptidoglycan lipid II flippase
VATWSARKVEGGWPAIQESMRKALLSAAVIVLPLVAIGIVLRDQLVTLAFQGGAYSNQDVSDTSAVFGAALAGLPFIVLSLIFSVLFVVQKETIVPMKLGFLNVTLNLGLNLVFRPLFGVAGIALSTSLTYAIINVAQASAARRRWGSFLPKSGMTSVAGVIGAVVLASAAAELLLLQLPSTDTRLEAVPVIAAVGGAGLLTYAAALLVGRRVLLETSGSAAKDSAHAV